MDNRNALAGAHEAGQDAAQLAVSIGELLDIWSKRSPLAVTALQQQELRRSFRAAHKALHQAEQEFEQALIAQRVPQPGRAVQPTLGAPKARKRAVAERVGA